MQVVVIDTNIVLDLWGFGDPRVQCLEERLMPGGGGPAWRWIATGPMREELSAVLQRPILQAAFSRRGRSHDGVRDAFDRHAELVAVPDPLSMSMRVHCTDHDDQKFIDLALAHGAWLLSKDKAVLKCKKRLALRGVSVMQALPA